VSRLTRFHHMDAFVYETITLYGVTFQTLPLTSMRLKG
jgi:hypothetical protein